MIIYIEPQAIFSLDDDNKLELVSFQRCLKLIHIDRENNNIYRCLDFMLATKDMNLSLMKIKKITLELPIRKIIETIPFEYNELVVYCFDSYEPLSVKFSTQLNTCSMITIPLDTQILERSILSIDITSLVLSRGKDVLAFCHILLWLTHPGLIFNICNYNTLISPKIRIDYIPNSVENPISYTWCAHFRAFGQECHELIEKEAFHFTEIDMGDITDFEYDQEKDTFIFLKPGCYLMRWVVNLQGSTAVTCVNIGILNRVTSELLEFNAPCILPGQMCGQHIIHVTQPNEQYAMINASNGHLLFSNLTLQASLTISKL